MGGLYYRVKGSAADPYRITLDGEGAALKCFCTCPAGRRAGKFCKHVAALLVGDVSKLVADGSDDPAEIRRVVDGSGLVAAAVSHKPADGGYPEIDEAYAATGSIAQAIGDRLDGLRRRGWVVEADAVGVAAYGSFKNGKRRQTSSAVIAWAGDDIEIDGAFMPGNKTRPFYVHGSSFARLSMAFARFVEQLDKAAQKHLPG